MIQNTIMQLLNYLQHITGSYGWAIVLLAVVIKAVLYVPTQQQFQAMKDMAAIQPEIKKLQEKHKDDPKKLQTEQMELFKKHKVNPLGGCLPILIQMPILWGIWGAISKHKTVFENAYFMWIRPEFAARSPIFLKKAVIAANLAQPDTIMLLLYAVSMFISQKLTAVDKATAQTQATMNLIMPVMFTYIMWAGNFPSALILYWLVFNVLSIFQQMMIMNKPSRVIVGDGIIDIKEEKKEEVKNL